MANRKLASRTSVCKYFSLSRREVIFFERMNFVNRITNDDPPRPVPVLVIKDSFCSGSKPLSVTWFKNSRKLELELVDASKMFLFLRAFLNCFPLYQLFKSSKCPSHFSIRLKILTSLVILMLSLIGVDSVLTTMPIMTQMLKNSYS